MAVNGIELAVGQVWKTRAGYHAKIISVDGRDPDYPVIADVDPDYGHKSYGLDGRFSTAEETTNDLIHYVCNDEVKADAPGEEWIKWSGGDCPVARWQAVRARLRNGCLAFDAESIAAGDLDWKQTGVPGDIVEYMVLPLSTPVTNVAVPKGFSTTAEQKKPVATPYDGASMFVPGYEKLAAVMAKAYDQAARGKGKERHANSKPFHEQPMLAICRNLGSIDGMLYQATKKAMEARGLPTKDRALAEIYGAINYLCGAAILIEEGIIKGQE